MHHDRCIRSDGDWICVAGCTHDRDEAISADRSELLKLRAENVRISTEHAELNRAFDIVSRNRDEWYEKSERLAARVRDLESAEYEMRARAIAIAEQQDCFSVARSIRALPIRAASEPMPMTDTTTPGQAAYEAYISESGSMEMPWEMLSDDGRARWERIAAGTELPPSQEMVGPVQCRGANG